MEQAPDSGSASGLQAVPAPFGATVMLPCSSKGEGRLEGRQSISGAGGKHWLPHLRMLILHGHLHCLKGTLLLDGMVGKGFKGRFSLHRETASEALSRVLVQAGPPTSCGTCHEIYLSEFLVPHG